MKEKNVVFISKETGTLNKEKLAELFIKAMDIESDVRVYVSKPNYPVPELVIIPRENIHFKLEYYNEVLDDTLRFKADKEVFILRAECRLSDARKYRLRADIPLLDSNTNVNAFNMSTTKDIRNWYIKKYANYLFVIKDSKHNKILFKIYDKKYYFYMFNINKIWYVQ